MSSSSQHTGCHCNWALVGVAILQEKKVFFGMPQCWAESRSRDSYLGRSERMLAFDSDDTSFTKSHRWPVG